MSRELTQNERRLAVLAAIGVLWGALLLAIGLAFPLVAVVIGGLILIAAVALQGRALAAGLTPRLGTARRRLRGTSQRVSTRVAGVDWSGKRESLARRGATVRRLAAGGAARTLAAGGTALSGVSTRARELGKEVGAKRTARPAAAPGRREAMRLSQQATVLRAEERLAEAVELGEQALAIFRALGDSHGAALTLNGLGLTQARLGDEAGALDSYEAAIELLTEIGDSHGAGRVLANLGALHRGRGHDAAARAAWNDALERLEPGTPEHDRMAQQLKLAS